jgi:TolA-binding protein
MATKTQPPTVEQAQLLLEQAMGQRDSIQDQLGTIAGELSRLPIGSQEWVQKGELAATLRQQLDELTPRIDELTEQAKTERQRETEARIRAQEIELQRQSDADLAEAEAIIATVNRLSDELAAAVKQYYAISNDARQRLAQTGKLRFSGDIAPDRALRSVPYVYRVDDLSQMRTREKVVGGEGRELRYSSARK